MKKPFLFFLLGLMISQPISAQTIGEAFYIYRNDGEFNAFFREEVDSMAYSCYDADSILHNDVVSQLIYTQDSIYKIPLVAIDSVSFITPEVIVNEKVFELTAAHDRYLSRCDTIRFTLKWYTPQEMCPSKGNIVVSTYDCLSFPDGIMARVVSKTQDADGIHYNCEQVGLQEVYDQLVFKGNGYIGDAVPQANGRNRVEATGNWNLWNCSWSETLEKGGTKTTVNVRDAARVTVTVNIQLGKPMYFRLDLQNDLTSSFSFNAKSSFEKYYEQQLAKVTFPRIRIPQCPLLFIVPKLTLSGYFAEGAEVDLKFWAHCNRTDKVSFVLQNNQWSVSHAPVNSADIDVASLSMTGYAEIGLIPDLFFSFCGSATGLGIESSVGIKESADFKFDAVAAFDEDMYSTLKDSRARTTLPWSVRAYAQVGMFGEGIQPISYKISREPQLGPEKYLLPAFSEFKVTPGAYYGYGAYSYEEILKGNDAFRLETQPSRDLLLPVNIDILVYEGDSCSYEWWLSSYHNQKDWEYPLGRRVYGMKMFKTYKAYPVVEIMGKKLRALPSKDFFALCPDDKHPHAIDLGLPSGTKWSCCNVGATMPAGLGGYYAWGETSEKSVYNEVSYSYSKADREDKNGDGWFEYDSNPYVNIGTDIAGTCYDVAAAQMGAPWLMPSGEQLAELCRNTKCSDPMPLNDMTVGVLITGPNGGQIFLPYAGIWWGEKLSIYQPYADTALNKYYSGSYWSSSMSLVVIPFGSYYDGEEKFARILSVRDIGIKTSSNTRCLGLSVRAVCP